MPAPTCTDAEFTELWRTHGSATKVAEVLGIGKRAAYQRRRNIERQENLALPSTAKPATAAHYAHLSPAEHAARRHFYVSDGVVLIFSDAHFWPGVRTTAFKALLLFIRELKPKAIICNGDAFDGASISRYPRIGWDSKPTVIQELKACKERLSEVEDAANGAKLYWPLGNHDARFENRLAQNAPEFEGVKGFSLKDHFPAWTPCWSVWINDEVVIKHRLKGGIHATRNNTLNAGKTTFTGHLHQLKVTPLDDYNGTRWGVDTGTLADPKGPQFVDYLEDGMTDWRSGFAVATFHDGDLLWPEVCRVKGEGLVDFRGLVIDVSKE
jgi:Calcineurin-like phosphoesterase